MGKKRKIYKINKAKKNENYKRTKNIIKL